VRKPRRLPLETLAPYIWQLPEAYHGGWGTRAAGQAPHPRIDWLNLFGNANPVEIEVGFGKGLFLVNSAQSRPSTNFFGIEIIRKYQLYAATRLAQRGLTNVKTCCGDAKLVLRDFVVPASVSAVHIFFPDPWWKTRHKKRTLFTREFAEIVYGVLQPGGHLHFVTDVADYFAMVSGLLAEMRAFTPTVTPEENIPAHDMDYLTNFERKFRQEGRGIYRSLYAKLAP
jgi:tRNA (guanine-N7-)-methyltransferase